MGNRKQPTPAPGTPGYTGPAQFKPTPPPSFTAYGHSDFAAAFALWLRRYNADPEAFAVAFGEPADYGDGCADYFVKLLRELFPSKA